MWIERKIEGDRSARMRLDAAPLSRRQARAARRPSTLLWVAVALWTGFTFVGYFTPIRALGAGGRCSSRSARGKCSGCCSTASPPTATPAGMREQVCKYMCPYARFQSAMFDQDTLIITYDAARGEPRGARAQGVDRAARAWATASTARMCVQVCPTGIDIRKGLQYECIGCAACIDACDQVMDKMGYAARPDPLHDRERAGRRLDAAADAGAACCARAC